jgi:hypothetical protein
MCASQVSRKLNTFCVLYKKDKKLNILSKAPTHSSTVQDNKQNETLALGRSRERREGSRPRWGGRG